MASEEETTEVLLAWARGNAELLSWLGAASLAVLVASALLIPVVVARLPEDTFLEGHSPVRRWRTLHPAFALTLRMARNLLGAVLVAAGFAMLVLPGQGLLTIFVGVLLLEFPGRRRLLLAVVSRRPVQRSLNWLRRKRRVPELRFEDQAPSRKERRATDDTTSATSTIRPDSPTKKKTSS